MHYWLMKSEPDVFGIEDLKKKGHSPWDGVRNYQARNFMRDMKVGDLVLFYHSSCQPPGVAGLARVTRESYPDPSSWDKKSAYFDPRSRPDKPLWFMVDVEYVETFPHFVPLDQLKADGSLSGIRVTQRGSRLSVQPVEQKHFGRIQALGRAR